MNQFIKHALTTKFNILSRRVASLPDELDIWLKHATANDTLGKNLSQIKAVNSFMMRLCKGNEQKLNDLDINGHVDVFLNNSLELTGNVIRSYVIWNFFRDRLELRFVPQFQKSLLMADLISYDCYTTIIERVEALRIPTNGFREYPLTGLVPEFSPATWPRGYRPPALQNLRLPVPVIDLPWDHLANPWELLTIAHEVGHDVDEDLGKLTKALLPIVTYQLETISTPMKRIRQWQNWAGEILADLIGILLTGPAFVPVLTGLLTLPKCDVRHIRSFDPHPPHYLRTFINTTLLRGLGFSQVAEDIETRWKALYGEPNYDFSPYLPEIETIIGCMLETPLNALQDQDGNQHSLNELIRFTSKDNKRIKETALKLIEGGPPENMPIRHALSAAQLAFEQMIQTDNASKLDLLAKNTLQTIIGLAPPKKLASRFSQKRLDQLVTTVFESPIEDFGIYWPSVREGK